MSLSDTFRIALHNLRVNLSRTVLTVCIVALVSALVMALLLMGIAFPQNRADFGTLLLRRSGARYSLAEGARLDTASGTVMPSAVSEEEFFTVREAARRHPDVLTDGMVLISPNESAVNALFACYGKSVAEMPVSDYVYSEKDPFGGTVFEEAVPRFGWDRISVSLPRLACKDFSFAEVPEGFLVSGRLWTEEDETQPVLWLNKAVADHCEREGRTLTAGDPAVLFCGRYTAGLCFPQGERELTVAGVFDPSVFDSDMESFYDVDFFVGYGYAAEYLLPYGWSEREIDYRFFAQEGLDYGAAYREMREFTGEVNAEIGLTFAVGEDGTSVNVERFRCSHLDDTMVLTQLNVFIVGLAVALALLILLFCIGSVANTIIISVDKNRKFLGLLKALGLDARGVKRIVLGETVLVVIAGVLAGVCLLLACYPVLRAAFDLIFGLLLSSFPVFYTVKLTLPVWLPAATAVLFLLFAVAFSRGSIGRILEQDAIRTIGEVT